MKKLFVILTRNSNFVIDCVESILKYHPDDDIIIVDSDSDDLSYVSKLKSKIKKINLIKNKNFMDGAIWYTYENYTNYTNYAFLQDSTELLTNIDFAFDSDITSVQYFNDYIDMNRDQFMIEKLKKYTGLDLTNKILGLFGPMMVCSRNFLDNVKKIGMSKVLPERKDCQNSMERVWGFVASHLGYDIKENCIEGIHRGQGFKDFKYVYKKYAERK
jgi:hypothetical protein